MDMEIDWFTDTDDYLRRFAYRSNDPKKVYRRKEERKRLETVKEKILKLLSDGEWHTNTELKQVSHRFSARIKELRDEGFTIERSYRGGGIWAYRLRRGGGSSRMRRYSR